MCHSEALHNKCVACEVYPRGISLEIMPCKSIGTERKCLLKKRVELSPTGFVWDTNMAVVTSCRKYSLWGGGGGGG